MLRITPLAQCCSRSPRRHRSRARTRTPFSFRRNKILQSSGAADANDSLVSGLVRTGLVRPCPMTFSGNIGHGSWGEGTEATLTVEKFDSTGVVIKRTDEPARQDQGHDCDSSRAIQRPVHRRRICFPVVARSLGRWKIIYLVRAGCTPTERAQDQYQRRPAGAQQLAHATGTTCRHTHRRRRGSGHRGSRRKWRPANRRSFRRQHCHRGALPRPTERRREVRWVPQGALFG